MKIAEIETDKKGELFIATKALRKDCSHFINSTLTPIYRGGSFRKLVGEIPIRKDRTPGLSSETQTSIFNLMIEKKFGIKKVRNISMFCSRDYNFADGFGAVSFIFPKNDSMVLSLGGVNDSAALVEDMYAKFGGLLYDVDRTSFYDFPTLKDAEDSLSGEHYDHVENALDSLYNYVTKKIDIKLISANNFHTLDKLDPLSELMIFDSSSAWGISCDESYQILNSKFAGKDIGTKKEYSKLLGLLKDAK